MMINVIIRFMHLYDDIAKEVYPDGGPESRSLTLLFLFLSLLFHLSMLLLIQQWARWEPSRIESKDPFVQLVDPETLAPPKQKELLLGTDREEDLKSIPPGKETKLPPIPKSLQPGLPPAAKGGKSPGAPRPQARPALPVPPSAPPAPAPSLSLPERPTAPDAVSPPPSESSPSAAEEVKKVFPLPSLPPGKGEARSDPTPRPGGLPGLPFADAKSLDRLAKVFSDQEQVPKDTISLNTDDLKYFSYMLKLKNKIEYIWRYPQAAAERGIQGDLLLNFTIHRDGRVSDVRVVSTSGYEILDVEAVRAIQEASPFAPLPDTWNEDRISITGHFLYYNRYTYLR
ncbi:MAG: energy transducer TonB [Candidatus Manganitrophaceae bacterium]|nr:MAG: energy transducer TonB [Candidatus Manganitrophaceae bacterium]